jgi:hypothetical protein
MLKPVPIHRPDSHPRAQAVVSHCPLFHRAAHHFPVGARRLSPPHVCAPALILCSSEKTRPMQLPCFHRHRALPLSLNALLPCRRSLAHRTAVNCHRQAPASSPPDTDALREPHRRPSSNPPPGIPKMKLVPMHFSAASTSPSTAVSGHGTTAMPPPRAPYRLHAAPRCASQHYRPTVRPSTVVPLWPICATVDCTSR